MIKTVEEGLDRYKRVLRGYFKRTAKLKKKYRHEDPWCWGEEDFGYVEFMTGSLRFMECALGLSKSEVKGIEEEVKAKLSKKE